MSTQSDFASYLLSIREMLADAHPLLPWLVLAAVPWLTVLCVRKYFPDVWTWLEFYGPKKAPLSRVFLAMPSVIITSALASLDGDTWVMVQGALVGLLAPMWHHFLKSLPKVPYE